MANEHDPQYDEAIDVVDGEAPGTAELGLGEGMDTSAFDEVTVETMPLEAQTPDRFSQFWEKQQAKPERRTGRLVIAWLLAALLGAGGGAGGAYLALKDRSTATNVNVVDPPLDPARTADSPAARVAAVVLPSIVQIRIDTDIQGNPRGIGSGVIYSKDGYVVTNHHVIQGANNIEVRLATGDTLTGALVGTAWPVVDIAILKLARNDLRAATFGTTKDLQVGDLAVAIGSPFGLSATVTAGVISALHRNELASRASPDAIQTDAPINQGNSGGALATANGTVIGINSSIFSESGGNVGVGFAIPVDIVRKVADQIIATGRVSLPYLGIGGDSVPDNGGALVRNVEDGGPADRAGIRAQDIIVAIDGEKIVSMEALIAFLVGKDVGDSVKVDLKRGGREIQVTATLGERPASG